MAACSRIPSLPAPRMRRSLPVACSARLISHYTGWETVSGTELSEITELATEARLEVDRAVGAAAEASMAAMSAKSEKNTAEHNLRRLETSFRMKSIRLQGEFEDKINFLMSENAMLMAHFTRPSFQKIIGDVEENNLSPDERSMPLRERWVLICSKNPLLFEKLTGCCPLWTTEADIADVVVEMDAKTFGFYHATALGARMSMDLPEEVATEEKLRLAKVLADEAGYALGFFASHPPYKLPYKRESDESGADEEDYRY